MARGGQELRWLQVYSDPLQHAAIAAAVVAPLAARAGRRVIGTAVTAALVIDVDHAVAARSMWPRATTALAQRPRTHSLLTAAAAGALVAVAAGPVHRVGRVRRAGVASAARRGGPQPEQRGADHPLRRGPVALPVLAGFGQEPGPDGDVALPGPDQLQHSAQLAGWVLAVGVQAPAVRVSTLQRLPVALRDPDLQPRL